MKRRPKITGAFVLHPLEMAAWLLPVMVLAVAAFVRLANHSNEPPARITECRINLNAASLEELSTIPGMTQRRAKALIGAREKRAGFERVSDLAGVSGFTHGYVRGIAELVEVAK